ncbi:MAG: hypothetical protein J6T10_20140 [Methanobrevibacter sp.]|nr:hypothetical protein [Methanobrevibacter sp.]
MDDLTPVYINPDKKPHESRPIRTAIGGALSGIADIPLLLRTGVNTLTKIPYKFMFQGKTPGEVFRDELAQQEKDTDMIYKFVGGTPRSEQNKTERRADFIGDMIPTIGTAGMYGLVKTPIKVGLNKAAKKTFREVAKESMKQGATKAQRMALLHQANKGMQPMMQKFMKNGVQDFSGGAFNPTILGSARKAALETKNPVRSIAEYMLPGIQVTKSEKLLPKFLKEGINSADDVAKAMKNVRKAQALEGGAQLIGNLGLYETMSAITKQDGLIGDYSDTLEHDMHKQESNWLVPAAIAATTLFGMHFSGKKLQQLYGTEYKNLIKDFKAQQTEYNLRNKHYENMPTIKQTDNNLATNMYDNTAFLDDDRFSYMFNPLDKANMRYDVTTSVNSVMSTGYPDVKGANIKPVELYNSMADLNKFHPKEWQTLEEYLDTNNKIASYINNHNIKNIGEDNFAKFTYMDDTNLPVILRNDPILQNLRQTSRNLRKQIDTNPVLKKLADDISLDSEIRLKMGVDSGRITPDEAQYLRKNYTVDGYYSYKPFVEQVPDKSIVDSIKDYTLAKELTQDAPMLGRVLRNTDQIAKSYTDTYLGSVMSDLKYAQKNSRIKAMIHAGFPRQFETIEQLSKEIGSAKETLRAIDERLLQSDVSDTAITKLGKTREKAERNLKELEQKALNLTHIEYLGSIKPRNHGTVTLATTPYEYLNRTKPPRINNVMSYADKHLKKDVIKDIQNYKTSKDVLMFTDANGEQHFFKVNPLLKQAVDLSPDLPNAFGLAMLRLKRTKQEFTTGAFNPMFAPTSAIFGLQESLAALPRLLSRPAKFKDYIDAIKFNGKAVKLQMARDMQQNIVNEWKSEWIHTMGDMSQSPMGKKYTEDMIRKMEVDIEDCLLTKFERAGAVAYRYPEGLKNTQYPLSMDMNLTQKLKRKLYDVWGAKKAIKCGQYIDYCTEALRNASTVGAMLHLKAVKNLQNSKDFRVAADLVSKNITDTKKAGIHVGAAGNILGFIGKYLPYGRVGINSIGAKLEALHAGDGITFLKAAKNQIKNADNTWGEVAHMVQLGATGLLGNQYLQSLYYTALIPTLGCYLWNHLSQENKQDYYTLSDYNKASKLTLANFYGKGKHLTIPLDQEVGVACKLYETMLDSILNLSKDNGVDPAFQNSRLLGIAMARSFNLEDMVVPEVLLNSAGMTSNFDIGSGGSLLDKLPMNQTNLDGSQTALQNGLMSQESHAIINTIFGAVGKSLANGAEQFNIGARDVGIGQGLKDFVTSTMQKDSRPIPFMPNSMMGVRAMTQTAQNVKGKIDTIDKLRKLNTFNSIDPTLVGKKGSKVQANIPQPTLDPKLQFASQVAQVAVPYYNDKIKPIYDQVNGIYKQIAAYNATGRDQFGNVVGTMDRWKYQQAKIKEVQQIYKQLYFEFEKLENILTNQFNRDINLTEFNNLQGV